VSKTASTAVVFRGSSASKAQVDRILAAADHSRKHDSGAVFNGGIDGEF